MPMPNVLAWTLHSERLPRVNASLTTASEELETYDHDLEYTSDFWLVLRGTIHVLAQDLDLPLYFLP